MRRLDSCLARSDSRSLLDFEMLVSAVSAVEDLQYFAILRYARRRTAVVEVVGLMSCWTPRPGLAGRAIAGENWSEGKAVMGIGYRRHNLCAAACRPFEVARADTWPWCKRVAVVLAFDAGTSGCRPVCRQKHCCAQLLRSAHQAVPPFDERYGDSVALRQTMDICMGRASWIDCACRSFPTCVNAAWLSARFLDQ